MREILFRGKDDESKDFVYGLLSLERDCRNPKILCTVKPCIVWGESGLLYSSFVIPETIGRYTGLTDKNGTKIFEGDIVKADNGHVSEVTFHFGAFCCYCHCHDTHNTLWSDILTVIGNIHDNPELLKGDKDNG